MSSQPKSPAKRTQPLAGPQVKTTRITQTNAAEKHESPRKKKTKCKVCSKSFSLFLSHLMRSDKCGAKYDLDVIEAEEKRQRRDRKAVYDKEYYNQHTPEKKAASKRLYQDNPEKKKETMAAYNEKHREDINLAMNKIYYESQFEDVTDYLCHSCDKAFLTKKSRDTHLEKFHSGKKQSMICQICDKTLDYKQNLERHMKEVHSGQKHTCDKCPAAFTRNSELQNHKKENWHYLSYYCSQCKQNIVFKSLGAMIRHVIVKQSESEMAYPADGSSYAGTTFTRKKSGISLTCQSHVESIQLEEGVYLEHLSKEQKMEAFRRRLKKKEEIINSGLNAAHGSYKKPRVKLEFVRAHDKKTHDQEIEDKGECWYCQMKDPIPLEEDEPGKERKERTIWDLQDWW